MNSNMNGVNRFLACIGYMLFMHQRQVSCKNASSMQLIYNLIWELSWDNLTRLPLNGLSHGEQNMNWSSRTRPFAEVTFRTLETRFRKIQHFVHRLSPKISRNAAPATTSDIPKAPTAVPARKSDAPTSFQLRQMLRLPHEASFALADGSTMIRTWFDHDPNIIRQWSEHNSTMNWRFGDAFNFGKIQHFALRLSPKFSWNAAAAATKSDATKCCACPKKWRSNITKCCACHVKWHSNSTKCCACHQKWCSNIIPALPNIVPATESRPAVVVVMWLCGDVVMWSGAMCELWWDVVVTWCDVRF